MYGGKGYFINSSFRGELMKKNSVLLLTGMIAGVGCSIPFGFPSEVVGGFILLLVVAFMAARGKEWPTKSESVLYFLIGFVVIFGGAVEINRVGILSSPWGLSLLGLAGLGALFVLFQLVASILRGERSIPEKLTMMLAVVGFAATLIP